MKSVPLLVAIPLLLLAGCATSAPEAALPKVQAQVQQASGFAATWPISQEERDHADAAVRELLAHDLTPDAAVRLALLNNRELRATLEELGLSQAGLAAATRLPNPSFDASVRWPRDVPRGPNVEFGVSVPLLETVLLPSRKRVAERQLVQTQYRVSHEVLALVASVRRSAYELLAKQDLRARIAVIAEINDAAADLGQRQFNAGNIAQRDLGELQASAQQTKVEVARSDAEIQLAREELNRLLGLTRNQTNWKMAGGLPALPASDHLPSDLETVALARRLDLSALRTERELAEKALGLKRRTRLLTGDASVGADTERDPDGARVSGPRVALELPLFDQGQPEIARLAAALRQVQDREVAFEATIGSEVRTAQESLRAARAAAEYYQRILLPQRRANLREALLHYNAMQISPYELLAAKERQQISERESVEALRNYWFARTELERAIGSRLPTPDIPAPEEKPAPAPQEDHSHHSHQSKES